MRQYDIVRLLNVPKQTVSKAVNRFKELGHDGRRPGSGRRRTVNTSANRQIIRKRVKRNSRVSMRKIARETGMKRESVRQMAKREFNLMPYKLQKVQLLTDENKCVRLQRCRQLKRRAAAQRWERILFTDRSCSPSSRRTTTKTTGAGPLRLPERWPLSNTAKIRSLSWSGAESALAVRHPSFSWIKESKSTKKSTDAAFSRLWYFRGPNGTLAM